MSSMIAFVADSNFYNNFKTQKIPFQFRSTFSAKVYPTTKEALLDSSIQGDLKLKFTN